MSADFFYTEEDRERDRQTTPTLSPHARERCEEMGILTRRIKNAVRDWGAARWPDPQGRPAWMVHSATEPDLLIIVAMDRTPQHVITVLWWDPEERLTREEAMRKHEDKRKQYEEDRERRRNGL